MAHQGNGSRAQNVRRTIAAQAARLMAEDGIGDYGLAKRKAARQLGVGEGEAAMPTNAEVEEQLRIYQSLYQDEEQAERLLEMREAALDAMHMLAPYRPCLTGPVLDGTAGRFSEIELEVFADSAKEVEIFLLNQGVRYEHREPRRGAHDAADAILLFDWEDVPVRLSVYDHIAERSPRRGSHTGKIAERARIDAVEALLRESADE